MREARAADDLSDAEHWQALCCLLLTKSNDWRKRSIIPARQYPNHAARMTALVNRLNGNDTLLALLSSIRTFPPSAYSAQEWHTVRNIFIVLRHAIAQLRVVFAEENVIDFAEAGIAAHGAIENPSVLMRLEDRVQHLLIDEFQDTSRPHFALLRALIQDWYPGDGRTCFSGRRSDAIDLPLPGRGVATFPPGPRAWNGNRNIASRINATAALDELPLGPGDRSACE